MTKPEAFKREIKEKEAKVTTAVDKPAVEHKVAKKAAAAPKEGTEKTLVKGKGSGKK